VGQIARPFGFFRWRPSSAAPLPYVASGGNAQGEGVAVIAGGGTFGGVGEAIGECWAQPITDIATGGTRLGIFPMRFLGVFPRTLTIGLPLAA